MKIYDNLLNKISEKGAVFLLLIDPDKTSGEDLVALVQECERSGVDALLIGGSLMMNGDLNAVIRTIKQNCSLPAIVFPGSVSQVSPYADGIFYLSLISGRNAEQLIGKHVIAAPLIRQYKVEPISVGYILVESGSVTTAQYMSDSNPVPRNKPEIAAATALAAQYLGMKMVYLEGGSGAKNSVPNEMVRIVSQYCDIPVIVGGGIKDPETAYEKVRNGAKAIVCGNFFEDKSNWPLIRSFAEAIHSFELKEKNS